MSEINNIYSTIFGKTPEVQAAAAARDASFQDWLNSRKQAVEQQRTDNVKMARLNALGNVLTTMVQPIGWAVGGKGTGVTGGVQPVDNRQYLDSFNRAMKAADDLRNIGTLEGEYKFNLADEAYRRAQAIEDSERSMDYKVALEGIKEKNKEEYSKLRQQQELDKILARGDVQKELTALRAKYRITKDGLSVDDRAIIAARREYQTYKRAMILQGKPFVSEEEYMKLDGIEMTPVDGKTEKGTKRVGW